MSRDRIYVRDADGTLRPAWTENVPGGHGETSHGWRGTMVTPVPTSEQARRREQMRAAAKRYREGKA